MGSAVSIRQYRFGVPDVQHQRDLLAMDIQPRMAKHGDRWRDADTEIESSLDSTDAPH